MLQKLNSADADSEAPSLPLCHKIGTARYPSADTKLFDLVKLPSIARSVSETMKS